MQELQIGWDILSIQFWLMLLRAKWYPYKGAIGVFVNGNRVCNFIESPILDMMIFCQNVTNAWGKKVYDFSS